MPPTGTGLPEMPRQVFAITTYLGAAIAHLEDATVDLGAASVDRIFAIDTQTEIARIESRLLDSYRDSHELRAHLRDSLTLAQRAGYQGHPDELFRPRNPRHVSHAVFLGASNAAVALIHASRASQLIGHQPSTARVRFLIAGLTMRYFHAAPRAAPAHATRPATGPWRQQ